MPTTINSQSGPINSIDDINKLSQADAVQTLRAISTQLKGADGKSSKSGVLSLVSAHDGQGLSFERKSFYQVGARSTTRMNDTKEALSTLARQAKLDFNAESALGNYLFDHKNKVGGREFADLLDTLVGKNADEAAGRNLRPAARWVPKALQDEVFGSKNDPKGRKNPSYAVENFVPDGVKKCQNFNCKYEVKGTNGIRLEGISRSANKGQTNFDISKPLVLAFGGSGMVAEELAYDNALSLKDGVKLALCTLSLEAGPFRIACLER